MTKLMMALAPHKSAFSLDEPFKISSNMSHPKTVVDTTANWLHWHESSEPDPIKLQKMAMFPDA